MRTDPITFQFAMHYLPKVALRLECLFFTVEQACHETHPVIHHSALKNIIEIIQLSEKPELKSRFLKEFMRIEHSINKAHICISDNLYAELFMQVQFLSHAAGRFGENIHEDSFLQSIRLSQNSKHNDCEAHSPQLLLWLESHHEKRRQDLSSWLQKIKTLAETVRIYLSLLRSSAEFSKIDMHNGFYQRSLPSRAACHLILLRMDKHCGMVPKIQLGHHGFSLRLCEANSMHEIGSVNTNVDLAICQL